MFTITKRIEIAGAHTLNLPYDSPCSKLHGHNWIIEVEVSAKQLNDYGMVIDFTVISQIVKQLDHQDINKVLEMNNATAENIAIWIGNKITESFVGAKDIWRCEVTKVTVQESEGNIACYIP